MFFFISIINLISSGISSRYNLKNAKKVNQYHHKLSIIVKKMYYIVLKFPRPFGSFKSSTFGELGLLDSIIRQLEFKPQCYLYAFIPFYLREALNNSDKIGLLLCHCHIELRFWLRLS